MRRLTCNNSMAYLKNWTDNFFPMFFMGTSWVAVSINNIKTRASREMTSRFYWGERCQALACGGARYLPSLIALLIMRCWFPSVVVEMVLRDHPLKCVQWMVLLCGALGRMFGGSPHFSIGQIDVKMFVVRAGWCPQLTNEHCEILFIQKCWCVYQ